MFKNKILGWVNFCVFLLCAFFLTQPIFSVTIYDEYGNPLRVVNTPKGSLVEKSTEKSEESSEDKSEDDAKETFEEKDLAEQNSGTFFSRISIEQSKASSIGDFLRQKGFLVMSTGGQGSKQELSFKGFTAFCIKVYVNGIYANNPATGEFDWNTIDLDSIESIEISERPKLGNTEFAGCCVYITTNHEDGKISSSKLSTHTVFSSYETKFFDSFYQSVHYSDCIVGASTENKANADIKNFKYDIFASGAYYDNMYKKGTNGLINNFNASQNANVNFNWSSVINKSFYMSGFNYFSYNGLKVYGSGQNLTTGLEKDYTTQSDVNFYYKPDIKSDKKDNNDELEFMTNLSYFYGQVDYFNKYDINNYENSDIDTTNSQVVNMTENMTYTWIDAFVGYKETHSFSANADRHEISFGVGKKYDGKKYDIDWFSIEPNINFLVYGVSDSTSAASSQETSDSSSSENMTWKFEYLPSLTFGFGDFYISGYRLVTLPTFNQLYWPQTSYAHGNSALQPEIGWAASIGYKSMNFPLFANFTYTYYKNKIRWTTDSEGLLVPENTSDADFYVGTVGYEQEVWSTIILEVDGSVTEARLRQTYKQIMWVPEFQAHAGINFNYEGFEVSTDYSFISKRYTSNDNVTSYPAIHLLNATLGYRFGGGGFDTTKNSGAKRIDGAQDSNAQNSGAKRKGEVLVYVRGENLLDQRVVYHDGYYIPSRKWTVGLKFTR